MDEPAAGLDPRARVELKHLIRILAEEGKTILLVTHEPDIGTRADRTMRLKDGKVDDVLENRSGR